jgi:hypothetical protein
MGMNKWESFAKITFHAMKGVLPFWKNANPFERRSMTRILYDQVFCAGEPNKTGYISSDAMSAKRKGNKTTKDHCLSPQFVARMVYDHADVWLTDYEKFKTLFYMCCQTIEITPEENNKLSKLTENRDGEFVIHVPTHKKYEHLNIILFHPEKGVVSDVFEDLVPKELIDYEKDYLSE